MKPEAKWKIAKWFSIVGFMIFAVLMVNGLIRRWIEDSETAKTQQSVSAQRKQHERTATPAPRSEATVLKLEIPAWSRAEFLPIAGMQPTVTGFGKFSSHAVRKDNKAVCTAGASDCANGPVWEKYYVENESNELVTATVTFK